MNQLKTALMDALSFFKPKKKAEFAFGKRSATATRKKSGKTRRGAKHKLGFLFRGRKIYKMVHAEYRRHHLGKTDVVPNYKKPHAAPRWRNRWTPQS